MTKNVLPILQQLEQFHPQHYANFISFEGGEGSGKSTVLKTVSELLKQDGLDVLATREPGGATSNKAELIRQLILNEQMSDMTPLTEGFLYAAARTQHVQETVLPSLKQGQIVLTDRFVDSSLAYQALQGQHLAEIVELNAIAIAGVLPKYTLFFDVPAQVGLDRVFSHRQEEVNYLDKRSIEYHEAIYDNFKILQQVFPERIISIDATQPLENVIQEVYNFIKQVCK